MFVEVSVRSKKGLFDGNDGFVKKLMEINILYFFVMEKEIVSSKLFDVFKENYNGSFKGEMEVGEYKGSKVFELLYYENLKISLVGSVWGDKKNRFGDDDVLGCLRKEYKGVKVFELVKKEIEVEKLKSGYKEYSSRK